MTPDAQTRVIRLSPGETALVGYGSLLSIRSLERTLGRPYEGAYLPCALRGWRRTWDVAMPNRSFYTVSTSSRMYPASILYLNVRRDPGCLLNGVLFVVGAADLARFDERESVYTRVNITGALERVRVEGGEAHVYVGLPQYCVYGVSSPEIAAVRSTYLAILEDGLSAHGPQFRLEYDASSDRPPGALVITDQT